MNIIDIQDDLKNLPEQALMQEMQRPTGSAPQFLVLGELKRRKQMREDYKRQQNSDMKTVAEEVVTAAGAPQEGIMQMARSLNPNTNMAQDTGLAQATPVTPTQAPQPVQRMQEGGLTGGMISSIANLKVNYPDIYETVKDDPEQLQLTAEYFLNVAETPAQTGLEQLETPRENDLLKRMFADPTRGDIIDQRKRDAAAFGADYALDQRAQSLVAQRLANADGNEMLFAEGEPTEYLTGNVSAGVGGSAVPMPGPDQPFTGGIASLAAPELSPDPAAISETIDVDPRAVDDASDFSNDPRRGAARPPAIPGMNDVLPIASIANARADADRDDLLRYLRGEGEDADLPAIVDEAAGENGSRLLFPRHLRDPDANLGPAGRLLLGDEAGASPRTDLNRRAQAYMQSDMYTPPEEIYDLGPRGRLKYEEAGDDEFTSVSDRLAREAAADARTKEDAFFAAEDARFDAQRAADAAIDRRISGDQPRDRAERVSDALSDIIGKGIDYLGAPRDRDPVLGPFGGAEGTPEAEAIIAQNLQDQQDADVTTVAEQATGTSTGTGTSTSTGGAGFGSMDSRIAQMLSNRQKEAESDKWMALAQTGMALMASKNPTFGGALGEAGLAGVGALQKSKQGARAFEADMLKLQTQLDIARQRTRGSSKLAPASLVTAAATALKTAQSAYENASTDAERLAASDDLIAARTRYEQISNAVASQYPGIASALTSGGTGSGRKQV
jgi:hypothetical protein